MYQISKYRVAQSFTKHLEPEDCSFWQTSVKSGVLIFTTLKANKPVELISTINSQKWAQGVVGLQYPSGSLLLVPARLLEEAAFPPRETLRADVEVAVLRRMPVVLMWQAESVCACHQAYRDSNHGDGPPLVALSDLLFNAVASGHETDGPGLGAAGDTSKEVGGTAPCTNNAHDIVLLGSEIFDGHSL